MIVLFPVGVPLALFILLVKNKSAIMERKTRSGDRELGYIGV